MKELFARMIRNFLLGAAAMLAASGMTSALAQSKPALVRDVDANGAQAIVLGCAESSWECTTTAVPAGKRMVVEMMTANLFSAIGDHGETVTYDLKGLRCLQTGTSPFSLIIPTQDVGKTSPPTQSLDRHPTGQVISG